MRSVLMHLTTDETGKNYIRHDIRLYRTFTSNHKDSYEILEIDSQCQIHGGFTRAIGAFYTASCD